ncbi:ABC-type transport auxiliary lipoprotein family protein [Candidatus Albibeggiatoa sp. nov. NOAA]|uniref:ABC-type transport auxiliary lipoprotein family protein n=1 Tax=Candidatus Albibeggiatoa sp. nov. NOAA TaxID=3162724 RepID=UPI0032FAEC84|nr:ABC-type transport auxiliary lipoprotein family protein [Thiotrichaceae bacterium]
MLTTFRFAPFLLLLLSSCSFLAADTPPKHYFIATDPVELPANQTDGKTILISIPQAVSGFDTQQMVYIKTPYVLEHYRDNLWVDTPARLLLPLIVQRLEATGKFGAVLSATSSPILGELRLDTEIIRLQQEFLETPSRVRVTLRIQLLDMTQRAILDTKTFDVTEIAPTEDAAGGVIATNRAVQVILEQLATFVVAHL